MEKGADIGSKDNCGNTALHIASYQGHPATVSLLLDWGATMQRNERGKNPLDIARDEEEQEVVDILENWKDEHGEVLEIRY